MPSTDLSQNYFNILFLLQINWYWQVVLVFSATFLMNFIIIKSLKSIEKKVKKTVNIWDDALLKSAYVPVRLIGWLIGFTLILEILYKYHNLTNLSSVFLQFRKIAFIVVLALFLYRLIDNIHQMVVVSKLSRTTIKPSHDVIDINNTDTSIDTNNSKIDSSSAEAIAKLLKISVLIISTLIILQVLGYSISGILAFGGMGGVAVGFAAKDLLANFFGGLMIYLDKPFKVGDWIRSPDRNIEGAVEHIGWRISRIRTFDKRPLYIPNSLFTNIIVENPSRMSHRRIKETIGVRYDDWKKIAQIVDEIQTMLVNHKDIDNSQTIICHLNKFSDSSIDFLLYAHTKTTHWVKFHTIKQEILLEVFTIIDNHNAEIAFPTQTLLMSNAVIETENMTHNSEINET